MINGVDRRSAGDSGPGGMAYIEHRSNACSRDLQAEAALGAFVIVRFTLP